MCYCFVQNTSPATAPPKAGRGTPHSLPYRQRINHRFGHAVNVNEFFELRVAGAAGSRAAYPFSNAK